MAALACAGGARAHAGPKGVTVTAPAPTPWNHVVLVELFTSQGCSSCPPAEALLANLPRLGVGRDKVVPLGFHVDIWDELGWRDPFADAAFTERQRWYVRSGRLRSPGPHGDGDGDGEITGAYTPQMIIDGQVHLPGGRRAAVTAEIRSAATRAPAMKLDASATAVSVSSTGRNPADGDVLVTVAVTPRRPVDPTADWRLRVALVASSARTQVLHGENAGETLRESAVVRALSEAIPLGQPPLRVTLRKPKDLGWADLAVVAFVQSERTRAIGGAIEVAVGLAR